MLHALPTQTLSISTMILSMMKTMIPTQVMTAEIPTLEMTAEIQILEVTAETSVMEEEAELVSVIALPY